MADVAATERPQTLVSRSDIPETDPDALGLDIEELRDGRRRRRVNHVIQLVQVYHRQARATGVTRGHKKRAAVAAVLWADVACQEDMKRKQKIMLVWERIAERAGLLRVCDGRGARALQWQLLTDWGRYAGGSRGYSSVGRAPGSHPGGREFESR
jgi:hypothetical protein